MAATRDTDRRGTGRLARLLVLGMLLGGTVAEAKTPHLIRYQGTVADQAGVPLHGPYTLRFRLYDVATSGAPLWQETQPSLPLTQGHFSVFLGSVTPLDVPFDRDMWLGIQVADDPEMVPRIRLASVPTAYRAERAEGADQAVVADRLRTPVTTTTISDDANRLVPRGAIILWQGGGCPAGYTRLVELDGRFLVGGDTYRAAAGGSAEHTHGAGSYAGPSHNHTGLTGGGNDGVNNQGAANTPPNGNDDHHFHAIASDGTGAVTGTSGSADSRPPFATVLLCQKD